MSQTPLSVWAYEIACSDEASASEARMGQAL